MPNVKFKRIDSPVELGKLPVGCAVFDRNGKLFERDGLLSWAEMGTTRDDAGTPALPVFVIYDNVTMSSLLNILNSKTES